jgi:hypothetical protein
MEVAGQVAGRACFFIAAKAEGAPSYAFFA